MCQTPAHTASNFTQACLLTMCFCVSPRAQDLIPLMASSIASMVERSGEVSFQKDCLEVSVYGNTPPPKTNGLWYTIFGGVS